MSLEKQFQTIKRSGAGMPLAGAITALVLTMVFSGCTRQPGLSGGTVAPEITLKGLSGDVSSVDVRVTGPGIDRSLTVTPSSTSLAMTFSPAENVRFELDAANDPAVDESVYTWGMTRYADLIAGEKLELDFMMGPKDTKIIIPDYYSFGGTIVQASSLEISETVPSLTADQWQEIAPVSGFPYDVALDNQGRVWVSYRDYFDPANSNPIVMLNDMGVAEPSYVISGVLGAALAFDRINSRLYYIADSSTLGRVSVSRDIAGIGAPETLDLQAEEEIAYISVFGLAADNEGYLYFAGADTLERPTIFKYDPRRSSGCRVIASYTGQEIVPIDMDLLVKNNHIYLTNPDGPAGSKILKMSRDLQIVDSFGTLVGPNETADQPGEMYRPSRFLATTDKEIYFIDDRYDPNASVNPNRIIRMDEIGGDDWKAYRPVDGGGSDYLSLFFAGT